MGEGRLMCDWMHQEGNCVARVERANRAMLLCYEAGDTARELERQLAAQVDQLDLFVEPVLPEAIAFWWGVQKACADELQRLSRLFYRRCHHPYVYRPLEAAHG